jgi:hypothetical protein
MSLSDLDNEGNAALERTATRGSEAATSVPPASHHDGELLGG